MLGLFSLLTPKNIIIPVALIAAASVSLYIWNSAKTIKDLREDIIALEVDKSRLTDAVKNQSATITYLRNQARLIEQEYRDTERAFADARRDADNLKKQLQASEVDDLSKQSSGASEIAINDTSTRLYRCFELLSGAPLNDSEKTAKNAQEFNYMCTWLFKP
jgi:predicted  nucleic acid-binding Zn-ribbon protein